MKTRPLCFVCLCFLLLQSILFILTGGESLKEIPASSVFRQKEGVSVFIQGQVYKKTNTSNIQVLYLKNNSIKFQNRLCYDSKLIVYMNEPTDISIGKTVCLGGTTGLFEEARNPGNYNQSLYYAKQKIYGAVWCNEIHSVAGKTNILRESLYQCKEKWSAKLIESMGEKNGTVLVAMLLGEKSEMDEEVKELYQKNGIGHILAISGLHISFIGLGIYRLIRRTGLGYFAAGVVSLFALSLYVMMIGSSVSVIRAYVMLLLRIGADMSGRVYDMMTALLLAAAITIGVQPLYLEDAGFYMSYGAILGILLLLPIIQKIFKCRRKCISSIYTSLSVNIMLFPILLWFYFEFPIYSFVLNFVVIPLMSLVLGFGMIGSFLLLWVEPAGKLCLQICDRILDLFELVSRMGSKLPMARFVIGQPKVWKVMIYYVILLAIVWIAHVGKKWKHLKRCRTYLYLIFVASVVLMVYRPIAGVTVTMLDVGQGDGIFVQGPSGTTCLIDGGSSDVDEIGKYRIEPYLKSMGVGDLDYAFITHGDADHYSGLAEMLARQTMGVKIRNLVLPANFQKDEKLLELAKTAKAAGSRVVCIRAGEQLREKGLCITCIQPSDNEELTGNAGSLVLEVCYGNFSMLCTGDVEGEGEETLLRHIQGKEYDVLKVAHHGSKNSTSEKFLKAICPRIALISVGEGNNYGHPHAETLMRIEDVNCQVFQTMENGAITIKTDGKNLRLVTVFD